MSGIRLTDEQQLFIDKAIEGSNILVDACVGSGKTTAIQHLCDAFPNNATGFYRTKRVLYLTYNRLLKIDAREKIIKNTVCVTNYHGFAFLRLKDAGIASGMSDLLQNFNKYKPPVGKWDVMILDEYQDIELEIAEMLDYIKEQNPGMQIIAVGDMAQKIYDKTTLDVPSYIEGLLGKHIGLEFTQCFRLDAEHAAFLSRVWGKKIVGVNNNCKVTYMRQFDVVKFLSGQEPGDVMCLGSKNGPMSEVLNRLESKYKDKYNKKTVYATISDNDRSSRVNPSKDTAIFTTFDSSKGLERKICVIFDWTESFWNTRINMPQVKYEILRNIFCVAASRGKEQIIFVNSTEGLKSGQASDMLTEKTLSTPVETRMRFDNMQMSTMFDFKYKEDVEECYGLLNISKVEKEDTVPIAARENDYLIDLTPCVGIYQEAMFFENYDIDRELELFRQVHQDVVVDMARYKKLDKKILYLTSLETSQKRYITQVEGDLMDDDAREKLAARLREEFDGKEEVQKECEIQFAGLTPMGSTGYLFTAAGIADVVKNNTIYELKFVSELQHEHFLQCAMYMTAFGIEKGKLWNVRTNTMYDIRIPDRAKFLDAVTKTVTKHQVMRYKKPKENHLWKKTFRDAEVV